MLQFTKDLKFRLEDLELLDGKDCYESSNLFRFVKNCCIVGETKFLFFDDQNCAEKEVEINMMFLQRLLFMYGIDIFNDGWK